MSILTRRSLIASAVAATGLAGAALAEDNTGTDWWPGWGMGRRMGGGGMMGWRGMMMGGYDPAGLLDRVDGRLADLKAGLKLTDAQAPAWDELAKTVKQTAETHSAMMTDMMQKMHSGEFWKMKLPDRLALQEAHLGARLEEMKAVRAAAGKLYAVLTPEQQAKADDMDLPVMGPGMGRRMMNW